MSIIELQFHVVDTVHKSFPVLHRLCKTFTVLLLVAKTSTIYNYSFHTLTHNRVNCIILIRHCPFKCARRETDFFFLRISFSSSTILNQFNLKSSLSLILFVKSFVPIGRHLSQTNFSSFAQLITSVPSWDHNSPKSTSGCPCARHIPTWQASIWRHWWTGISPMSHVAAALSSRCTSRIDCPWSRGTGTEQHRFQSSPSRPRLDVFLPPCSASRTKKARTKRQLAFDSIFLRRASIY